MSRETGNLFTSVLMYKSGVFFFCFKKLKIIIIISFYKRGNFFFFFRSNKSVVGKKRNGRDEKQEREET